MDFTSTWFGVSTFIFPAVHSDTWFLLDTLKQMHLVIMGFQKEKKLFQSLSAFVQGHGSVVRRFHHLGYLPGSLTKSLSSRLT